MPKQYVRIMLPGMDGQQQTAVYLWTPRIKPRAVVQVIHGMKEHMGRYDDFAAFLNAMGYAVCGHDHLGHGKSMLSPSDFGYFGRRHGPRRLLAECRRMTALMQEVFPGIPVFLLGHSMGSYIGRLHILHAASDFSGFICMGTGGENPLVPLARVLAEFAVGVQGARAEGRLLSKLTFASFNRQFPDDPSPLAWLSRDPQVARAYECDPLIRPYFTNAGLRDLYEIQMAACKNEWAERLDKTLPILLASGTKDPVGDYSKGVLQVFQQLQSAGMRDVECKLYDNARHELLNELNREEVYYDLYSWMEERIDQREPMYRKAAKE